MHKNGDNDDDDDGGNGGDCDDDDVQVIDHEEDNLSDKETYSKNIPAIGEIDILGVAFSIQLTGEMSCLVSFAVLFNRSNKINHIYTLNVSDYLK